MRRRDFAPLIGAAATWPIAARAQQPAMPVVAFFSAGTPASFQKLLAAFLLGLREQGFVERQNVAIEYHYAEDQYDTLPAMAAEIVRRRPAVIVASPRASAAAKAATSTIPIVFQAGSDPVINGLVASLNRPGGNLTGMTILATDLTAKRFGLLHQAIPDAKVIGVLLEPSGLAQNFAGSEAEAAAHSVGVQTRIIVVRTEDEIETAFATFAREGIGAVFVANSLLFFGLRELLAVAAARHRVPASYELREHVDVGGLMSYGPNVADVYRQVGRYTGRILKGEKPADLPVMLPTRFEFVLNLKAVKVLGLTIPPGVLAIVDEVIE